VLRTLAGVSGEGGVAYDPALRRARTSENDVPAKFAASTFHALR
jgi:hypothetical protein